MCSLRVHISQAIHAMINIKVSTMAVTRPRDKVTIHFFSPQSDTRGFFHNSITISQSVSRKSELKRSSFRTQNSKSAALAGHLCSTLGAEGVSLEGDSRAARLYGAISSDTSTAAEPSDCSVATQPLRCSRGTQL